MQFWSGDHLAIEVSGPGGASEVVVRHPYALIGTLAGADVRLSGDGVQKRAALLYAVDGKVMCRRLEAALPEAYSEVPQGDWLPLGKHRLRVRIIHDSSDSGAFDLDTKLRIPVLRVRHKKARTSVNRRLYKTIETVGRSGDCELELRCPQASLYHCVLLREANRLWCIDLGSGNGTLLNGQRIECALVEMGGKLRVGDYELEFQRYSRRSRAPLSADNAGGSNLSLSSPFREDRLAELVPRDDADIPAGESVFGSNIVNSVAPLHSPPSSLSKLAALPAPQPEGLQFLQDKQAELLAAQAGLLNKLEALSAENMQLRADQEALSQQVSQRLDEHRITLAAELSKQPQAEQQGAIDDLLLRLEELRASTAQDISTQIEALKQSLEQQWTESLRQSLSREISDRLAESSQIQGDELSKRIESLQQNLRHKLQEHLETLAKAQTDQLLGDSRAQRDSLTKELAQRFDELAKTQTQQLKLQSEAHSSALTQELIRRIDAALEGRLQTATSSEPERQPVSEQWLQRLDDLRNAQSDEIALAVSTQGQTLSQQLAQRLDDLQKTLMQDLARQIEEQRQTLLHDLSHQIDAKTSQSQAARGKSRRDQLDHWQKATAQALSDRIQRQGEALLEKLAQQLASQAVEREELLTQSTRELQDKLNDQQAKLLAAQVDEVRQSLSQDLLQQVEAQHSARSQELLRKLETQQSTATNHQQAHADALNQRIEPLQETLNQLLAQQSQLVSRLAAQADELKATRHELHDLRSRAPETPVREAPETQPDWQPVELADTPRAADLASPDSGVLSASDAAESEFVELRQGTSGADSTVLPQTLHRTPAPIDEDDPLLHFVSDRLAQLDTGRQRLTIVYWSVGIPAVVLLAILAWALVTWLPGYLQQR